MIAASNDLTQTPSPLHEWDGSGVIRLMLPPPRQEGRMATNVNVSLAEIEVLDAAGEPHRLGALWAERPVLLALIRHFG